MILGIVVLVSILLSVFIFSYNSMVRQQNIRAHHEMITEVAGILALTGLQLFAEQIKSQLNTLIQTAAPMLLSSIPTTNQFILPENHPTCRKMAQDFNLLLSQLDYLIDYSTIPPKGPKCLKMEILFEQIQQIAPSTDADQFQAGRDPVEKVGEITISCTVEYNGVKQRAMIKRQFRVVSMVPGAFSRFTLFVPYTPWAHSFNSMGMNYNGTIDGGYTHPYPAPTGRKFTNPLKVINGTHSFTIGDPPDDLKDLRNRGWIFLGPSHDPGTGPVVLKLPSGYDNTTGGHFLFALPPGLSGNPIKREVVPPEQIEDPAHFDLPGTTGVASFMMGGIFQGFFTRDPGLGIADESKGVAGWNLWTGVTSTPPRPFPDDRWLSASSWLYIFGDRFNPSRTLVIGPVLAGFLKLYFLKDNMSPTPAWKVTIRGVPEPSYNPSAQVPDVKATPAQSPLLKDLFKEPPVPDPKAGYTSFTKVMPLNTVPNPGNLPPQAGVAFNCLFDFMRYPGIGFPYPRMEDGSAALGAITNQYFVPNGQAMNNPVSGIKGIHPFEAVTIKFQETDPGDPADNVFFNGDLCRFRITDSNLLGRISHFLLLTDSANVTQENTRFRDFLFRPSTSSDPCGSNWWIPKRTGIFYVKRRSSASSGGDRLILPGKIYLDRPLIIIVEKGDIEIPSAVESPITGGAPANLFTLVALEGDLYLGTSSQIHAYLVALNPGAGGGSGGGRLLSAHPNSIRSFQIFGGLAIWEMGLYQADTVRTTMGDFTDGGTIQYNPRFNPGGETYPSSRVFLMEDKASEVAITGGD